jgi:flagellar assembly factor FliW
MTFEVKSEILGFENLKELKLTKIDEMFSTLSSTKDENISFTVVDPHKLREYNFDISDEVEKTLAITDEEELMVYNIVLIQNPLDTSKINFLAPLVFNKANNTMAQTVLEVNNHQEYGLSESLKTYL